VEIPRTKMGKQHTLKLDKGFRDVLADYLRRRWPSGTAKYAAREFDISLDRAREAVAGRVSLSTLERIFQRGGLSVALPIVADVIGQSLAHYFREMRTAHDESGKRLTALFGPFDVGLRAGDRGDPGGAWTRPDERDAPARRVGEG
jgi:hypothetical protein